jgi:hypothetical protein
MPRIRYTDWKPRTETLRLVRQANAICAEYAAQGLVLTLRQLYYQFVARGLLANLQTEYKRLGSVLNDARMAGLMDWDYLVDRTRNLAALPHWSSPTEIVEAVARQFRTDRWADQPCRVEVWIEKDAGIGVIEAVCQRNQVPYFSCRGYTSVSEIWAGAQRLRGHLEAGQRVVVLHIGDHDPSGLDMSRDIEERMGLFIQKDQAYSIAGWVAERLQAEGHEDASGYFQALSSEKRDALWEEAYADLDAGRWGDLEIRRIALNYDQVEQYQPPPNPAKTTDARFRRYVEDTGLDESWELDALDPVVLQNLIEDTIGSLRDAERWDAATERMESQRRLLQEAADRWTEVTDFLAE